MLGLAVYAILITIGFVTASRGAIQIKHAHAKTKEALAEANLQFNRLYAERDRLLAERAATRRISAVAACASSFRPLRATVTLDNICGLGRWSTGKPSGDILLKQIRLAGPPPAREVDIRGYPSAPTVLTLRSANTSVLVWDLSVLVPGDGWIKLSTTAEGETIHHADLQRLFELNVWHADMDPIVLEVVAVERLELR